MDTQIQTNKKWAVASYALRDVYTDFILSRQAMLCTPSTIEWYQKLLGKILEWLEMNGVTTPEQISARHVRAYLSEFAGRGKSDSYIHSYARVFRAFLIFLHKEKYIDNPVEFTMPSVEKKRQPVLSAEELKRLLNACQTPRDRAVVLVMADTGVRRTEACALNWEDVDLSTGIVQVRRGKGKKARTVFVGVHTRRALLAYRRTINHNDNSPLFLSQLNARLTPMGLRSLFKRIGNKSGIKITPHALRRTFATLSLREGMNLLELQALMGHSSLDMTKRYIELLVDDLVEAHKEHGVVDNLFDLSTR